MSQKATKDEILKLIRLVDSDFMFTHFDFFLRGRNAFASVAFIVFFAVIWVYVVFAPVYEQIVVFTSFSALVIGYFSLMSRFGEEHILNVNFKKIGMRIDRNKKPFLKALLKMKTRNPELALEQIYNINKSIFSKEKLLERLCE